MRMDANKKPDQLPPPPAGMQYRPLPVMEVAKLKDAREWPLEYKPGLRELM